MTTLASKLSPDIQLALAIATDNLSKLRDYLLDRAEYDFEYSEYPSGSYHGNAEARFSEEVEYEIRMLNRLNHSENLDVKYECKTCAAALDECVQWFADQAIRWEPPGKKPVAWVHPNPKGRDAQKYLVAAVAQLERVAEGK